MRTPGSTLPTCHGGRARDAPPTASADAPATRLYKRARKRACDAPGKTCPRTLLRRASKKNAPVDAPAMYRGTFSRARWHTVMRGFCLPGGAPGSQPARGYFMAGRLSCPASGPCARPSITSLRRCASHAPANAPGTATVVAPGDVRGEPGKAPDEEVRGGTYCWRVL